MDLADLERGWGEVGPPATVKHQDVVTKDLSLVREVVSDQDSRVARCLCREGFLNEGLPIFSGKNTLLLM
jgi:hypothetical protein